MFLTGEFTKRAFYAGKFDLTEVEGLSDLIDAETEMQRKQALHQMEGSLREIYYRWRKTIVEVNLTIIVLYTVFRKRRNGRIVQEAINFPDQIDRVLTKARFHQHDSLSSVS